MLGARVGRDVALARVVTCLARRVILRRYKMTESKSLVSGLAVLATGLLASAISSFLQHFAGAGPATEFAREGYVGANVNIEGRRGTEYVIRTRLVGP